MIQAIENKFTEHRFLQTIVILIVIIGAAVAASMRIGSIEGRLLSAEKQIQTNAQFSERILKLEARPSEGFQSWFQYQFTDFKKDMNKKMDDIASNLKTINADILTIKIQIATKPEKKEG